MLKTIYHHLAQYRLFWILAILVPPSVVGIMLRYFPFLFIVVTMGVGGGVLCVVMWKVTGLLAEEFKEEEK